MRRPYCQHSYVRAIWTDGNDKVVLTDRDDSILDDELLLELGRKRACEARLDEAGVKLVNHMVPYPGPRSGTGYQR